MLHNMVYERYCQLFPKYAENTVEYFPSGKNCIRVRQNDKKEFVFTIIGEKCWSFETLDSFMDRAKTKGGK